MAQLTPQVLEDLINLFIERTFISRSNAFSPPASRARPKEYAG
jgi:hypothetical protein